MKTEIDLNSAFFTLFFLFINNFARVGLKRRLTIDILVILICKCFANVSFGNDDSFIS